MLKVKKWGEFSQSILENDKKIILFGAGVIGRITAIDILEKLGLQSRILFFVDNDKQLWKKTIVEKGYKYLVLPPEVLSNIVDNKIVIMINVSRYVDVLSQVIKINQLSNNDIYITPMLCVYNYCLGQSYGKAEYSSNLIIPKTIHYMWFGKKSIPDNLRYCINTWKRFCPDYEIVEWNEDNYDIDKHPYMKQAYEKGAYGFVPDYARLDILYNYGGFYLDTDVELIRSLDELRYQEAFCGVEKWQVLNFGGCSGAVKNSEMIGRFLEGRKNVEFLNDDGSFNRTTCGYYDTKVALQNGYVVNGKTQCVKGMNIYAYDYFHPYDYMTGTTIITKNTYSIHHFNGGWLDDIMKEQNRIASQKYMELYQKCIENSLL